MLPVSELRKILLDIPLASESGLWTRAVRYQLLQKAPPGFPRDSAPQPLWPGGPARTGARFTPLGSFGSLYLASDAVTALCEVSAVFEGAGTIRTPPWTVFAVEGFLERVLDLTDSEIQSCLDTSLAELTGDWLLSQDLHQEGKGPLPPTQLLAKVAYDTGTITAIRYRSTKNIRGGVNLMVFSDRLKPGRPSYLSVYDPSGLLRQKLPEKRI